MFIKSPTIFQAFARQKEETATKALSRNQWIMADRIVVIALFAMVIVGAFVFG
ncbi:hypothetical protein [Pedobacter sp. JCM 36344]|uniref:hypothetical protein n=1 Tax=Pedobacter sp. JCM 36344 TaxID=3374280 RepID=UPI003978FA4B